MEEKYKKAITAGVICGIILVILALIGNVVVNLLFQSSLQQFMNDYTSYGGYYGSYGSTPTIPAGIWAMLIIDLVLVVLGALTFVAAGVLAARMAAPSLRDMNDALITGAIAGAVAEVIHRPFAMVFSFVMNLIMPSSSYYGSSTSGTVLGALTGTFSSLICCFPVILVCGVILAAAGAAAYAALRLKK